MTVHQAFSTMEDHRNLLPNLNCLGIWQIGETAIYGPSGFSGIRGQVLREPDAEDWNSLVVQAVVSFLSADSAKKFYDRSFQRWSKCSNHRVNLTINGRPGFRPSCLPEIEHLVAPGRADVDVDVVDHYVPPVDDQARAVGLAVRHPFRFAW